MKLLINIIVLIALCNSEEDDAIKAEMTQSQRIMAQSFLTTPELIKLNGYPVESHKIQTVDGYILEIHRIPKKNGIPVLLQHGLMDSSAGWVLMGPETSFAYYLSDLGYDVWLGNIRGNRYSRRHATLNPDKKDFWDFSFNEIGKYDIPAMVDYIIETTGCDKMHYVGHSQGTTVFFVMCALHPEYADKIISMHAMAPIAYLHYVRSPIIMAIATFITQLDWLSKISGTYEYMPQNDAVTLSGQYLCKKESLLQSICTNSIFLITGFNSEQLNKTMIPIILGHVPAGSSTKQFIHFGQLVNSGQFRKYDYGYAGNYLKYGSISPPKYDLSRVTTPVALYCGKNDWLSDLRDVEHLHQDLPNVIKNYHIENVKFNHLDFIYAIEGRNLIQDEVVKTMKEVESKSEGKCLKRNTD